MMVYIRGQTLEKSILEKMYDVHEEIFIITSQENNIKKPPDRTGKLFNIHYVKIEVFISERAS